MNWQYSSLKPLLGLWTPDWYLGQSSDHAMVLDRVIQLTGQGLNILEADVATRFALQMAEQSSQGHKFFRALSVQAMIKLCFVDWRIEMVVQCCVATEPVPTNVTHPVSPIECSVSSNVSNISFAMPSDLLFGDPTSGIELPNRAVNSLAVPLASHGTRASFEMMRYTACSDKLIPAERARDLGTAVESGIPMLST